MPLYGADSPAPPEKDKYGGRPAIGGNVGATGGRPLVPPLLKGDTGGFALRCGAGFPACPTHLVATGLRDGRFFFLLRTPVIFYTEFSS